VSTAATPSFDAFPQGMAFLKQFWAQGAAAGIPSAAFTAAQAAANTPPASAPLSAPFMQAMTQYMMPTMDIAELDKRITDLRTVLQFMEMNTKLLHQSLQTLEVQRNTIALFHSMAQPAAPTVNAAVPPNATHPAQPARSTTPKKTAASKPAIEKKPTLRVKKHLDVES
jgi:hypothetical protein